MSVKRQFEQNIHNSLEIFRYIFSDEKIITKIDEIYEDAIMSMIKTIPEEFIEIIWKGTEIFKSIYHSIDFTKLCENIDKLPFETKNKLDLFKISKSYIEGIEDVKIRNGVLTIVKKLKVIIDCFTLAINNPSKYLSKFKVVKDDVLEDIFG